ncbi:MAG: beta-phosphoglucomutase [Anaerolineae bacterium]|nr:beta-phosphoglucomutase [Anaerolineae bacterium]
MTWIVSETEFAPQKLHHKETVFTIGNGYLGTRGAFEEGYPGAQPATLIHGVFDDAPIVYTELANCPDWLPIYVFVEGERFRLDRGEVLVYRRQLDLRRGLLSRDVRWRSPAGHTVDLHWERFASLSDEHVVAVRCQIMAVDTSCTVEVQAALNGYPDNMGLLHWSWLDQGFEDGAAWLHTRTRRSGLELGLAMHLAVDEAAPVEAMNAHNVPALTSTFVAHPGRLITVDKTVTIFSSRDVAQPAQAARAWLASLADYPALLATHTAAWASVWAASDVIIEGDPVAQIAIRHSLFQVLAAVPRHDDRVSVSAKTLSGFGYRGHAFWDTEIFLLPFLTYTQPALARNLLTYRYHTLPGARRKAKQNGYEGAMYAWESAQTGDEVTPRWVPGPQGEELVRIWCGDIELHITADVAYAVWHYGQVTGDDDWMRRYGVEILLDTAVFWGSRAEWNPARQRYEINDVIGPDENHEHVNNNAFTNRMIQWHLQRALDVLAWLRKTDAERAAELIARLDLTPQRLAHWQDVIDKIVILQDAESGLFEQFEGFFALDDVNLDEYEPRGRSMQAILGIEGANRRQVLKQADVIMMLYLLRDGYDRETLRANWDYYNGRTDHAYGSSLGPAVHAAVACMMDDPAKAYEHWMRAALVDLEDVRGNASEGVHAASAGGLWQAIVFGFAGVQLTDAGPVAVPRLPPGWTRLKFRLHWRGQWFDLDIRPNPRPDEVRGVIFDLDGVLTDTSEFHYLGWKRLADEEGIPFDHQRNEALRGVSRRESLILLLDGRPATEEQIQEMMARKNRYYQEYVEQVTLDNLLPGALALLDELRQAGIKIAIGSASKNAQAVIDRLGLEERIDAISDGYSVQKPKPAPDLFMHAAAQLGLQPWQCIVVEDAASGVEAALAGGMWALGLGPKERVGEAHVALPSLEGVRWKDILARLIEKY